MKSKSSKIDLEKECIVNAVQVNFTDFRSDVYDSIEERVYPQFRFYASMDGKKWTIISDNTNESKRDRPIAYVELPSCIIA